MECVKYTYHIEWSVEDQCYMAQVKEIPTVKAFGASPEEALRQLRIKQLNNKECE